MSRAAGAAFPIKELSRDLLPSSAIATHIRFSAREGIRTKIIYYPRYPHGYNLPRAERNSTKNAIFDSPCTSKPFLITHTGLWHLTRLRPVFYSDSACAWPAPRHLFCNRLLHGLAPRRAKHNRPSSRHPFRRHSNPKPAASHTSRLSTSPKPSTPPLPAPKPRQNGPHRPRQRRYRFRHHVPLHRRRCPGGFPSRPPTAFSPCQYNCSCPHSLPLLSEEIHHPALHFRPARDRNAERLRSKRQRKQREQRRKRERE